MAGLLAATALFLVLPQTLYRTEAVIGVGDATTPLRDAMTDAATSAAVSKPVMTLAATSLVGTDVAAPRPGMLDRLWVTAGFDKAVGETARLADSLTAAVDARSPAPGVVKISAETDDPTRAARMATAVAESLVAQQDRQAADLRRQGEIRADQRRERLTSAVQAARQRFTALGGIEADPARAIAAAASQTAAAQARLDVVKSIIASGTPPLSDRHDLPSNAAALQAAYLALSQQLTTARETLGDRHTTVISLREGLKRAAANLTDEWKRLGKIAETELATARQREASAQKAQASVDPAKRTALEDARRTIMVAEEAVAANDGVRHDATTEAHSYRLIAEAPIPNTSIGFSLVWRLLMSVLAGLVSLVLVRRLSSVSFLAAGSSDHLAGSPARLKPQMPDQDREEPAFFTSDDVPVAAPRKPTIAPRPAPVPRHAPLTVSSIGRRAPRIKDRDLGDAAFELLPSLQTIVTQNEIAVVIVATNQAGTATMPAALALGQAAADAGHRVLLIEAVGSGAALAAEVASDAEPALVDMFGTLRIALPADVPRGLLYVAPAFRDGQRLAADLARKSAVPLIDELADVFDLVIVDSAETIAAAGAEAVADAFIRVATHASALEDDRFLARFGLSQGAFLGTLTPSEFVPPQQIELPRIVASSRSQTPPVRPQARVPARPAVVGRRKVAARH